VRLHVTISRLASRFGAYFLPDNPHDLRERFYEGLCLVAAVLSIGVVLPVNAAQSLPVTINVALTIFGGLSAWLWVLARRGHTFPGLFLVAQLGVLGVGWFPNAGSHGSVPYYFFVPLCYSILLFDGVRAWAFCALVLAEPIGLTVLEHQVPGLLTPFQSERDRLIDISTGLVVSGVTCSLIIWMAVTSYRRERQRLRVALDALTRSEDRFEKMFQVNPDAVFLFDAEKGTFTDVNHGFTQLTGWRREDTMNRTATDLGLWVDLSARDQFQDAVQSSRTVHSFRARFRRRSGEIFWGSVSLSLVEDDGRILALATTRDITGQVNAERENAESRAQLSTLINSTDDMIWLVEPTAFRLTLFNRAFSQKHEADLGVAPRLGLAPEDFLPPALAEEWRGFYRRALDEGAFTIEYTLPGTDSFTLHSFSPVRAADRTVGVAVFGKDITERRHDQEQREHMELQVAEAQRMESLGRLAGGVAHDFNNMLGGIMGYADLLLQDEDDQQRRQDLEAILQAATRSAELTRKLLAFGRRGRNIVEAVDLNAILQDSAAMLRPSFRPDVVVSIEPECSWSIDADPSQMNQLVVNLCVNGNEAMPEGGWLRLRTSDVHLDAGASGALPPGDYVELTVSDTGIGMPDEVRARIFEPFFTTKVRGSSPGTGLGLSTVYGIVHLHHGSIDVISAPGEGTTFVVRMPKGVLDPRAPSDDTRAAGRGHGLVLVVEDEPLLRRFAREALGKLGYDTVTAVDGEEGVAIFAERHGELAGVLLDLKMPRKDGRETFLAFRELNPTVPVLICSGYGDNEEAQGLISLGARGLLPKPYRLNDLAEQLSSFSRPNTPS